jgi:uncharacterized coiled-coil protein SlyX
MLSLNNNSETEHLRATVEAAKLTADRAHREVSALEARVGRYGHRGILSVIALFLLIALTGACGWWLNSQLHAQGSSIVKVLGMERTVDSLSQRMIGAETALSAMPMELKRITGRVDALDKRVTAVQKIATAKPQPAADAVAAAVQSDISQLNERVATLQMQHEADMTELESMRNELAGFRNETTEQIASVKSSIPKDASWDVAELRTSLDKHQAGIASLANKLDRDRSDFEIREDHMNEVAPGVFLTIKDTNVGKQQISGWLYLESEHRFVYLKNHGLLEPITVYGVFDKQARDIVITRVRKSDAIGYVLSPKTEVSMSAGN